MVEYNKINTKLSNHRVNKLKSAVKTRFTTQIIFNSKTNDKNKKCN